MNKKIHPLATNPTYVLHSSIGTNSICSWQVEMGKILASCATRPSFVFNLTFFSIEWPAQIRWIAL